MFAFISKLYQKPKYVLPKPINFKHHKKAYLRYCYTAHFWRWIRYTTIGAIMMGIGFGILYIAISELGLKPVLGYLIENTILMQVSFAINRYLTFGDRDMPWFKALLKWYGVKAFGFGAGQGIFFLLVNIAGLQYMLASLTIAVSLGVITYMLSNIFAFSGRMAPKFLRA